MITKHFVSSATMTGQVDTDAAGVIVAAPQVWRVFVGQKLGNLLGWLRKVTRGSVSANTMD